MNSGFVLCCCNTEKHTCKSLHFPKSVAQQNMYELFPNFCLHFPNPLGFFTDRWDCPVYTGQTNPGSTRLCSPARTNTKTRVNTNLGRARVSFSHAGQLVAFTGEVIIFCNQVHCFRTFSLTFVSIMATKRPSVHVQNQN